MTNSKFNYQDVFRAFLVENADYVGEEEMPVLRKCSKFPNRVILFSKALRTNDYDQWVIFYEHDVNFVRVWNQPRKYLPILKKFRGVISADFSLYRNMPLCMQKWSTYQNRALANWWQENGIEVIPNVRFADERTYDFCFDGIPRNSVVSVGSLGCFKSKEDKEYFIKGFDELVKRLEPRAVVIYGTAPDDIFMPYKNKGIIIKNFDCECKRVHSAKEVE